MMVGLCQGTSLYPRSSARIRTMWGLGFAFLEMLEEKMNRRRKMRSRRMIDFVFSIFTFLLFGSKSNFARSGHWRLKPMENERKTEKNPKKEGRKREEVGCRREYEGEDRGRGKRTEEEGEDGGREKERR